MTSFVQAVASNSAGSGSTLTLTLSGVTTTVGNTLIAYIANSSTTVKSITDSKGNHWSLDKVGAGAGSEAFACIASAPITTALVNADTITITLSASANNSRAGCSEFSGVLAAKDVTQEKTTSSGSSGTTVTTVNTPAENNELVISAINAGGATLPTGWSITSPDPDSGFTWTQMTNTGDHWLGAAYQIATSQSLFSAAWTASGESVDLYDALIVTYKTSVNTIQVRGTSFLKASGNTNSFTVPAPANVKPNDFVMVMLTSSATNQIFTQTAGDSLASIPSVSSTSTFQFFYYTAGNNPSTSYTFQLNSGQSHANNAVAIAYTGVQGFDVGTTGPSVSIQANSASTTLSENGFDTTNDTATSLLDQLVWFAFTDGGSGTPGNITAPTSFNTQLSQQNASGGSHNLGMYIADQAWTSTGAYGAANGTVSSSEANYALLVALQPVAAPGAPIGIMARTGGQAEYFNQVPTYADSAQSFNDTLVSSTTATLNQPVAAGDLLVGYVNVPATGLTHTNLSDTVGNTWTVLTESNLCSIIFTISAAAPAGLTLTLTSPSGTGYLMILLDRFTGGKFTELSSTEVTINTTACTATAINAPAGAFVWAGFHCDQGSITFTPTTGNLGQQGTIQGSGNGHSGFTLYDQAAPGGNLALSATASGGTPSSGEMGEVTFSFVSSNAAVWGGTGINYRRPYNRLVWERFSTILVASIGPPGIVARMARMGGVVNSTPTGLLDDFGANFYDTFGVPGSATCVVGGTGITWRKNTQISRGYQRSFAVNKNIPGAGFTGGQVYQRPRKYYRTRMITGNQGANWTAVIGAPVVPGKPGQMPLACVPVPRKDKRQRFWIGNDPQPWDAVYGQPNTYGAKQPLTTRQPRRTSARAVTRNVSSPVLQSGSRQPLTTRQPRRTSARGSYRAVYSPVNAPGMTQPWPTIATPRRKSARAVFSILAVPHYPLTSGTPQPWGSVPLPRRKTARGIGTGQTGFNPHFLRYIQPWPTIATPRRKTARTYVGNDPQPWDAVYGQVNTHGVVQPRATIAIPRRYPSRARYFIQTVPSAFPVPFVINHSNPPLPRRKSARAGYWQKSTPPAGIFGQAQPRTTIAVPRRYPFRAVVRFSPPYLGGLIGKTQPLPTFAPQRKDKRQRYWIGNDPQPWDSFPVAPHYNGQTQPVSTRQPRRTSARLVWLRSAQGEPFIEYEEPRTIIPIPRRYPSRGQYHGNAVGALAPRYVQARGNVPVPRRRSARAVVAFVLGPNWFFGTGGKTMPVAVTVKRRTGTRATVRLQKGTVLTNCTFGIAFNITETGGRDWCISFKIHKPKTDPQSLAEQPWLSTYNW